MGRGSRFVGLGTGTHFDVGVEAGAALFLPVGPSLEVHLVGGGGLQLQGVAQASVTVGGAAREGGGQAETERSQQCCPGAGVGPRWSSPQQ